jgi:lysophospholipase L1-like esterase
MLARLSSAVPEGTKIVILQFGGNDFRRNAPPEMRQANIASIQQELRKRGIRMVQADGLVRSARAAGLVQPDGVHQLRRAIDGLRLNYFHPFVDCRLAKRTNLQSSL